jgi:hypothetical protein
MVRIYFVRLKEKYCYPKVYLIGALKTTLTSVKMKIIVIVSVTGDQQARTTVNNNKNSSNNSNSKTK